MIVVLLSPSGVYAIPTSMLWLGPYDVADPLQKPTMFGTRPVVMTVAQVWNPSSWTEHVRPLFIDEISFPDNAVG